MRHIHVTGGMPRTELVPGITLWTVSADPPGSFRLEVDDERFRAWLLGERWAAGPSLAGNGGNVNAEPTQPQPED